MAGGILLQSAATTGNGNAFDCRGVPGPYRITVKAAGTITGGAVQFESAPSTDYSGTWSPVGSSFSPATDTFQSAQVEGSYRAIRARITSTITGGGTVTCCVEPPRVQR